MSSEIHNFLIGGGTGVVQWEGKLQTLTDIVHHVATRKMALNLADEVLLLNLLGKKIVVDPTSDKLFNQLNQKPHGRGLRDLLTEIDPQEGLIWREHVPDISSYEEIQFFFSNLFEKELMKSNIDNTESTHKLFTMLSGDTIKCLLTGTSLKKPLATRFFEQKSFGFGKEGQCKKGEYFFSTFEKQARELLSPISDQEWSELFMGKNLSYLPHDPFSHYEIIGSPSAMQWISTHASLDQMNDFLFCRKFANQTLIRIVASIENPESIKKLFEICGSNYYWMQAFTQQNGPAAFMWEDSLSEFMNATVTALFDCCKNVCLKYPEFKFDELLFSQNPLPRAVRLRNIQVIHELTHFYNLFPSPPDWKKKLLKSLGETALKTILFPYDLRKTPKIIEALFKFCDLDPTLLSLLVPKETMEETLTELYETCGFGILFNLNLPPDWLLNSTLQDKIADHLLKELKKGNIDEVDKILSYIDSPHLLSILKGTEESGTLARQLFQANRQVADYFFGPFQRKAREKIPISDKEWGHLLSVEDASQWEP